MNVPPLRFMGCSLMMLMAAPSWPASDFATAAVELCEKDHYKAAIVYGRPKPPVIVILKSPDGEATGWSYSESHQIGALAANDEQRPNTIICIAETFEQIGTYGPLVERPAFTRKWEARFHTGDGARMGWMWLEALPPMEFSASDEGKGARPFEALQTAFKQISASGQFFPFSTAVVRFAQNGELMLEGGVLRETATARPRFERDWKWADALALSEDGALAAVDQASKRRGKIVETIELWDLTAGKVARTWDLEETARQVTFSPDLRLVAALTGKNIHVWDRENGRAVTSLPNDGIVQIEFLDGGRLLAAGSSIVIHGRPGTPAVVLEPERLRVTKFALSGDRQRVALRTPDEISVRSLPDWQVVRRFPIKMSRTLALSPDGRRLAVGESDAVVLWDIDEGRQVERLPTINEPEVIAFSTDGTRLFATSRASQIDRILGKEHQKTMAQIRILGGSKPRLRASPILWSWSVASQ